RQLHAAPRSSSPANRCLHSFPTRRSSDLGQRTTVWKERTAGRPDQRSDTTTVEQSTMQRRRITGQETHTTTLHGGLLDGRGVARSEEHTSELQSHLNLVCRLLLEKKTRSS